MGEFSTAAGTDWQALAASAEARAEGWIADLRGSAAPETVLTGVRNDPEGFEFTRKLLDLVVGTEDSFTSALGLREAAQEAPGSMPVRDRIVMRAGGVASLGLPWAVMPVARRWLRDRVSHLVLPVKLPDRASSGRQAALAEALREQSDQGLCPVVQPLGERVHGPAGAEAEIARLAALAAQPALSQLVVDPARVVPGGDDWSSDADIVRAADALRPVLDAGAEHGTRILLAPRSVRWARNIPAVLERALADPALDHVRVGARLLAELPESREHYDRLSRWAQRRVADGGAPPEVVIGVGRVLGAERIASIGSGLAVPVLEDATEITAQLLRLIDLALHPGRAAVIRPVIASEDPRVLAATAILARDRGLSELFSVQVRSGVIPALAAILRQELADVRVLLPVVTPREYSGAVDLLIAFAAEAVDPDSAVSQLSAALAAEDGAADSLLERERARFRAAAERAGDPAPDSHRTQNRAREWDPSERDSPLFYRQPDETARFDTGGLTAAVLGLGRGDTGELVLAEFAPARAVPVISESGFANEPETDASLPVNREWARGVLLRAERQAEAHDPINDTVALSAADLDPDAAAVGAREAAGRWSAHAHRTRAVLLRRTALAVVAARDRLLQTLALDTGAPVGELDGEIDDIVDASRYCGQLAEGLGTVRGATFVPDHLVLVVADASTPLSAQAGAVLAALAGGSGVLWSVPQRVHTSARALVEEWEAGGLTAGAVHVEAVAVGRTLTELAAEPAVDRAVVFGDREAAHELSRLRPGLRIEGRFRGSGSVLVTPSADLDGAIPEIVASGLRAGGADLRAAHAVVMLGSVGRSRRFREGLADAVRGIRVGDTARPGASDPLGFTLGPLSAPPSDGALRALTVLGRGEEWLVRPQQLDDEGLLWSPGLRAGVSAGSAFWEEAIGVPVIGLAHVHTLEEAVSLQNSSGGGAAAALFSNDADEILAWLDAIESASVTLNRATTGARVERQPSGGWNEAVVGLPALSGGPNWLVTQGSWVLREGTPSDTLHLRGLEPEVRLLIEAAQPHLSYRDFDGVRRAALSDALTWRTGLGVLRDTIGLGVERNVLRHRPVETQVRLAEGASLGELVRVIAAALLVRAPISVSTGEVLPAEVAAALSRQAIDVSLERDEDWLERLAVSGVREPGSAARARVRLIGGDRVRAAEWLGGPDRAALWAEPVTMAGNVELMTLLREQSISARAHRHGLAIPVPGLDELLDA